MADQTPLTEEEIAEIKRLFGSPFFIPGGFKSWMGDQLALHIPDLPLGSLFGGRGITRGLDATTAGSAVSASPTTAQPLYTKVIQGKTLGANGRIRMVMECNQVLPSSGQTIYTELRFGGQIVTFVQDIQSSTNRHIVYQAEIYNANSPNLQYGSLDRLRLTDGLGMSNTVTGNNNGSVAVDTTVDQEFGIYIRWDGNNPNDRITRAYVNLEIINPVPLGAAG